MVYGEESCKVIPKKELLRGLSAARRLCNPGLGELKELRVNLFTAVVMSHGEGPCKYPLPFGLRI